MIISYVKQTKLNIRVKKAKEKEKVFIYLFICFFSSFIKNQIQIIYLGYGRLTYLVILSIELNTYTCRYVLARSIILDTFFSLIYF